MNERPSLSAPKVLATERLVLRHPRLSDAGDMFDNYAADPEVTRYLIWRPYKEKSEVAAFLQSRLERWEWGDEFSWAIARPDDDRVIGMIACRVPDHAANIGYVLSRSSGIAVTQPKPPAQWLTGRSSSRPFIECGQCVT